MSGTRTPKGYNTVNPYLTVNNASALLDFIKNVFGAEELDCYRHPDGKIAHGALRIGDSVVELSDASEQWGPTPCALHVYVDNCDDIYNRAVAAGATSLYEPMDHFYGERSGAVKDAFGNSWYIATFLEEVSNEELDRRKQS